VKSILISSPGRCGMHWIADVLGDLTPLSKTKTRRAENFQFLPNSILLTHDPITKFRFATSEFKTIAIVRDPRDVVVSAAYYWMMKPPRDLETRRRFLGLDEMPAHVTFDKVLNILKVRGHNPMWWEAYLVSDLPHHRIRYEDMWHNPHQTIIEAMHYLRCNPYLPQIDAAIQKQKRCRFLSKGRGRGEEDVNDHYRKGIIGDYKNYFTEEENWAFCQRWSGTMEALGYEE